MTNDKPDFRKALQESAREGRTSELEHPEENVLEAYRSGTLEGLEKDDVRRHLVSCEKCLELHLWWAEPEPESEEPEAEVDDGEVDRAWETFSHRVANPLEPQPISEAAEAAGDDGDVDQALKTVNHHLANPSHPEAVSRRWQLVAAAALLAALAAGIGWWQSARLQEQAVAAGDELVAALGVAEAGRREAKQRFDQLARSSGALAEPVANTVILYPPVERPRGEAEPAVVQAPVGADAFVLVLDVAGAEFPSYRVTLWGEGASELWSQSGLVPDDTGNLILIFPRTYLTDGQYTLVLAGEQPQGIAEIRRLVLRL